MPVPWAAASSWGEQPPAALGSEGLQGARAEAAGWAAGAGREPCSLGDTSFDLALSTAKKCFERWLSSVADCLKDKQVRNSPG